MATHDHFITKGAKLEKDLAVVTLPKSRTRSMEEIRRAVAGPMVICSLQEIAFSSALPDHPPIRAICSNIYWRC